MKLNLATASTSFLAIRACIFGQDGLLINSEDTITLTMNELLEKYGRSAFIPSIRAQLMGVPDSTNGNVFHNWLKLPIPREQFACELQDQMRRNFRNCTPLPGVETLPLNFSRVCNVSGDWMRVVWVYVVAEYQENDVAGTEMTEIGNNW